MRINIIVGISDTFDMPDDIIKWNCNDNSCSKS